MTRTKPLIELHDCSLILDDHTILDDVSFALRAGERWALIGANGSGKTMLLKMLRGDMWPTPTGRELKEFLDRGIETLGRLQDKPLREPTPLPDETIVPIQDLLYRGRAAVERARVIRDELRRRPGSPPQDVIDELYDLLDLALAE